MGHTENEEDIQVASELMDDIRVSGNLKAPYDLTLRQPD